MLGLLGDNGLDVFLDWENLLGEEARWNDLFADVLCHWLGDMVFQHDFTVLG